MDYSDTQPRRFTIAAVFAVAGSLATNSAIGWAVVHSPDHARFAAMHGLPSSTMTASVVTLPTINVCAHRERA